MTNPSTSEQFADFFAAALLARDLFPDTPATDDTEEND